MKAQYAAIGHNYLVFTMAPMPLTFVCGTKTLAEAKAAVHDAVAGEGESDGMIGDYLTIIKAERLYAEQIGEPTLMDLARAAIDQEMIAREKTSPEHWEQCLDAARAEALAEAQD